MRRPGEDGPRNEKLFQEPPRTCSPVVKKFEFPCNIFILIIAIEIFCNATKDLFELNLLATARPSIRRINQSLCLSKPHCEFRLRNGRGKNIYWSTFISKSKERKFFDFLHCPFEPQPNSTGQSANWAGFYGAC